MPESSDRPSEHPEAPKSPARKKDVDIGSLDVSTPGTPDPAHRFSFGSHRTETADSKLEERSRGDGTDHIETEWTEGNERGERTETRETPRPEGWSEAKWTFVEREAGELQQRVDRAMEVAAEMPNLEGLSLDPTEFENLAQNVRITGALLKEEIDRFVSEPNDQGGFSVNALLASRLKEVERLEERARPLQGAVDTQPGGGPAATAAPKAHGRIVSWLLDLKNWLKGALDSFWALISQLLTPKEWTIGGKVGTGVLGSQR